MWTRHHGAARVLCDNPSEEATADTTDVGSSKLKSRACGATRSAAVVPGYLSPKPLKRFWNFAT